jgi:hypothetical protein
MSIFDFKKKVYKNDIFCYLEESYTWSFFILIQALFVLIQVLISYPGPIFLEYFPEISGFSRIFPSFSKFFLCSQTVFPNVFDTVYANDLQV